MSLKSKKTNYLLFALIVNFNWIYESFTKKKNNKKNDNFYHLEYFKFFYKRIYFLKNSEDSDFFL